MDEMMLWFNALPAYGQVVMAVVGVIVALYVVRVVFAIGVIIFAMVIGIIGAILQEMG